MLRYTLNMQQVRLANHPLEWPSPLDLRIALAEVVLLEEVAWGEVPAFWQAAATLVKPLEGTVLHWGKKREDLTRPEFFRLRRLIGYIAFGQTLFQHLTLGQNIALAVSYYQGVSLSQALAAQDELVEDLELGPFLDRRPDHVSPDIYWRAIWARELAKGPELILACLDGPGFSAANQAILVKVLKKYLAAWRVAFLLGGPELTPFYPLAHRLLRPTAQGFAEMPLLKRWEISPVHFFPLV